jgi:hypothetical protein
VFIRDGTKVLALLGSRTPISAFIVESGSTDMTSIGELMMLDHQVEDLRRRIDIEKERLAQIEMQSQNPSRATAALDELENQLEMLLAQRDKTVRELEGGQQLKAS